MQLPLHQAPDSQSASCSRLTTESPAASAESESMAAPAAVLGELKWKAVALETTIAEHLRPRQRAEMPLCTALLLYISCGDSLLVHVIGLQFSAGSAQDKPRLLLPGCRCTMARHV